MKKICICTIILARHSDFLRREKYLYNDVETVANNGLKTSSEAKPLRQSARVSLRRTHSMLPVLSADLTLCSVLLRIAAPPPFHHPILHFYTFERDRGHVGGSIH